MKTTYLQGFKYKILCNFFEKNDYTIRMTKSVGFKLEIEIVCVSFLSNKIFFFVFGQCLNWKKIMTYGR